MTCDGLGNLVASWWRGYTAAPNMNCYVWGPDADLHQRAIDEGVKAARWEREWRAVRSQRARTVAIWSLTDSKLVLHFAAKGDT